MCEELGISTRQLRQWRDADTEYGEEAAFSAHGKSRDEEITLPKQELAKVKKEGDLFKEAARYFAKESR